VDSPFVDARAVHGVELVGQHGLRVVEQPADERRFAVVHAARGGEPEQIAHQK